MVNRYCAFILISTTWKEYLRSFRRLLNLLTLMILQLGTMGIFLFYLPTLLELVMVLTFKVGEILLCGLVLPGLWSYTNRLMLDYTDRDKLRTVL